MDSARQASTAQRRVMVLTREPRLAEHILAVCAAADVEAEMLTDPAGLRGLWSAAALVIVGMDQAEQVVELMLPHRPHIYLVDDGSDRDPTGWSVCLGAAVVALPAAAPGW